MAGSSPMISPGIGQYSVAANREFTWRLRTSDKAPEDRVRVPVRQRSFGARIGARAESCNDMTDAPNGIEYVTLLPATWSAILDDHLENDTCNHRSDEAEPEIRREHRTAHQ